MSGLIKKFDTIEAQALVSAAETRSWNAAIEAAKDVAGQHSARLPSDNDFYRGYACGRADAATAIEALARQP